TAGNLVGGLASAPGTGAGNVISGNGGNGLLLYAATDSAVEGNLIGLNAAGSARLANGGSGILVQNGTTGVTIGGTATGSRNIISGNAGYGINFDGLSYAANTADTV